MYARIFIFANNIKRHVCVGAWLTYISKWQSDLAILRGFYLYKTSQMHLRSFAKIKPWPNNSEFTVNNHIIIYM